MGRFGFCGPSYQSESVNSDCQRSVNLYPETNESGQGNSAVILRRSPGLSVFCALPEGPVRGQFTFNGRTFAVGGTRFCEALAGGTVNNIGAVGNDGLPAMFAANQANQLLILSAGTIYLYDLVGNTLTQPAAAPTNVSRIGFTDGFFAALLKNSSQWQLSNSLDGVTWTGINTAKVSVFPDNLVSMITDHRELALLGSKQSVIYYDSGNTFPYDVVPGGFIEQGCAATYAVDRLDNSVFWLGADERGQGIAWRNNGYTPQRVSTHAVEQIWAKYPRISDAISYAFQDGGHTFWHIYFPSGLNDSGLPLGASWRYDAATQSWHEVAFWDAVNGRYTAHRSANHAFAFGMHLVGDWNSANIYIMDTGLLDDFGNPIRRMRRAPHVGTPGRRTFGNALQLFVETGVPQNTELRGPSSAPSAFPSSFVLQDANGVLWSVSIDDSGNLNRIQIASGTPQILILADSGMVPTTAWTIGITIAGNLTATPFDFLGSGYGEGGYGEGGYGSGAPAGYPQIYPMMSTPGNHLTGLLVTADGLLQTDAPSQGREPQICARWSRDWGHTWSSEHWRGAGMPGEFMKRVIWRRLGWWWDWVLEITMTDSVAWAIVDADLDASPGFQPTERLVHQLRKGA